MQTPRADQTDPVRTTTVLLEHTLPDGSFHYDWLIERPADPSEHRMITFRCQTDPLADPDHPWTGERLPDHRAQYITHEGPVSGDRGSVRRLWSNTCTVLELTTDRVTVRLLSLPEPLHVGITRDPRGHWARSIGPPR